MAVTVQDEHQALGSWDVDVDWTPALLAELVGDDRRPRKVHALIYDVNSVLIYCGPLLRVAGDERGLRIGGRGLAWFMGAGDDGKMIDDHEFVAGTNKLSNGNLDLVDLYWETDEGTLWAFSAGSATLSAAPVEDDVMGSSESWPVRWRQEYRQTLTATRTSGSTTKGRLRLRRTYTGRFTHPELAVGYDQWGGGSYGDITISTDPAKVIDGQSHVLKIHTVNRELIANNSFVEALTVGWEQETPTWGIVGGVPGSDGTVLRTAGGGPASKGIRALNVDGAGPGYFFPVVPGEEYFWDTWVSEEAGTDGSAIPGMYVGTGEAIAPNIWIWHDMETLEGSGDTRWRYYHDTFTVQEPFTVMRPTIHVFNHTAGAWLFDNVHLWRTKGNNDSASSLSGFAGIPGRRYTAKLKFRSDTKVTGTVQMRAYCTGSGRDPHVLQGPTLQATEGAVEEATWDIVLPSGYDVAIPRVFSGDVKGGFFWVGEWSIRDADASTLVLETKTPATHGSHTPTVDGMVPKGAESVTVEVVAEESAGGWRLDNVDFRRINVAPATGNAIVATLLSGLPLTVGAVNCPEVIPYDWHVVNMTRRQALEHYCNVVSDPPREYRVNPDRSVDVGTAQAVNVDHAPASANPIVLLPEDIDVGDLPVIEADVEERATHIKVVGAKRTRQDGFAYLVSATAAVPGTPEYDWNGALIRRTRIVSDGTVDHIGYAQALADDLAAQEAEPALSVEATLTGVNTRPAFREGGWIYVYDPEAGLEDVDNVTTIDGRTVFPRRVRVLGRTRELGPSHRIDIRRTDGTFVTLTGVRWSDKDATSLTIGDRRPDWQADPQGHSAAVQYMRDRISAPR